MKLFHACFFDSMLTWPFSSTHFWLSIRDASCFHSQDFSVGVGSSSPDPILDIHTSYKNVLGCKSWVHVWKRTALRVFHVTELLFHAVEKALSGNVGLVGSIRWPGSRSVQTSLKAILYSDAVLLSLFWILLKYQKFDTFPIISLLDGFVNLFVQRPVALYPRSTWCKANKLFYYSMQNQENVAQSYFVSAKPIKQWMQLTFVREH